MKSPMLFLASLLLAPCSYAVTRYVAIASTNPVSPFITWETAATNIQDAIDISVSNDTVVVSNGVYATGGRIIYGAMNNRIAITNAIVVRSVNGCGATLIKGDHGSGPFSDGATRCAYVGAKATLSGFTLTNGSSRFFMGDYAREQRGGGAWCESSATIVNCLITGNTANDYGGGVQGGTLSNCILRANVAGNCGGGAAMATLVNCLIVGNSCGVTGGGVCGGDVVGGPSATLNNCTLAGNTSGSFGGAVTDASVNNCVVYFNTPANYKFPQTMNASCTTPLPFGSANMTNDPAFVDAAGGDYRLRAASPCVDAGDNTLMRGSTDLDGNPREVSGVVDMGAYEYQGGAIPPSVDNSGGASAITIDAATLNGHLLISGSVSTQVRIYWGPTDGGTNAVAWTNVADFGVRSIGPFSTNIAGLAATSWYFYRAWASNGAGVSWAPNSASFLTVVPLRVSPGSYDFGCVATGSVNRTQFALTNIGMVALTGTVSTAGSAFTIEGARDYVLDPGAFTNVTVVFAPLRVQGFTGAVIFASSGGGSTNLLIGTGTRIMTWFVATNGSDSAAGTDWSSALRTIQTAIDLAASNDTILVSNGVYETGGRVVFGALTNRIAITNAVTVRSVNGAMVTAIKGTYGAHVFGEDAVRCAYVGVNASLVGFTLTNGSTRFYWGDFEHEQRGGGAWCEPTARIRDCIITGNRAQEFAGGVFGGTCYNCAFFGNDAANVGGGVAKGSFNNCLMVGNTASIGGAAVGGYGMWSTTLNNCTLVGNVSARSEFGAVVDCMVNNCIVYSNGNESVSNLWNYSCITFMPTGGVGNIAVDPQFVDPAGGNYRLKTTSPCIQKGSPAYVDGSTDLDGNPRLSYGRVDMGAYQAQVPMTYGLWADAITNGLTNDHDCATADGYPNLLKYATGSSATDRDNLAVLTIAGGTPLPGIRFHRNTNAHDVTLVVEGSVAASNDAIWSGIATNRLGSWGAVTNVVEVGTGTPVVVTVRDAGFPSTNRFLRLRVTRP